MDIMNLIRDPPGYLTASLVCSLGGFLFGIDTGIIGPVTVQDDFKQHIGVHPSPTIHGLIVSSILIPAAISSFFAGRLADALGRSRGIAIGSFVFALGAALEAGSIHISMFITGRIVEGIGEGLYLGTLVVYICEITPPRVRGALTTVPQLFITLGLMTGFFTCYGAVNIDSSFSWRLPFLLLAAYAFLFSAVAFLYLPPSPRWLSLHGRMAEAQHAWETLGVPSADREKIINQVDNTTSPNSITMTETPVPTPSPTSIRSPDKDKSSLSSLFSPKSRPRLLLAVFLMGMQQLSGIDGVLYYAPLLFQQAGLDSNKSTFLASGVSAILIFAVTVPATFYADKWGRRTSTVLGGLGMTVTMFLMGGIYTSSSSSSATWGRYLVIGCIYVFAVIYCITWGVSIKLSAAEIQTPESRASATSIAHGSNWIANFAVALFTPLLLDASAYGAYFLFGGCTLLTAVVCWFCLPETRGRSLDDIDAAFGQHGGWFHGGARTEGTMMKKMLKISGLAGRRRRVTLAVEGSDRLDMS
ncbi:General substrate transporter [Naviculisporaceae sp. PSN 640]